MEFRSNAIALNNELERLAVTISEPAPALQQIADMMRSRFASSLERGISPDGIPHPPLKSPRRSNRRGGSIAGTLFSAVQGNRVEVGYEHDLAIIYHQGSQIPARKVVPKNKQALFWAGAKHPVKSVQIPTVVIPPRPLVGYTEADVSQMENLMSQNWGIK